MSVIHLSYQLLCSYIILLLQRTYQNRIKRRKAVSQNTCELLHFDPQKHLVQTGHLHSNNINWPVINADWPGPTVAISSSLWEVQSCTSFFYRHSLFEGVNKFIHVFECAKYKNSTLQVSVKGGMYLTYSIPALQKFMPLPKVDFLCLQYFKRGVSFC